jgi:hypothetical protein
MIIMRILENPGKSVSGRMHNPRPRNGIHNI